MRCNQNKYKQLVEQFGDSVILLNKEGLIYEVNSHFCNVSKYSEEELLKSNIHKVFLDENFQKSLHNTVEKSTLIETFLQTKEGEFIPKEIRISKILFDDELFYLVIARDMRERLKSLKKILRKLVAVFSLKVELVLGQTYRLKYP